MRTQFGVDSTATAGASSQSKYFECRFAAGLDTRLSQNIPTQLNGVALNFVSANHR